jgi:hypothetical protein
VVFIEAKSKIYVLLAVVFILAGIFTYYWLYEYKPNKPIISQKCTPTISFSKEDSYLFVDYIINPCNLSESVLVWENVDLSGNAELPTGSIRDGDIISDCEGQIILIWIPDDVKIFNDFV